MSAGGPKMAPAKQGPSPAAARRRAQKRQPPQSARRWQGSRGGGVPSAAEKPLRGGTAVPARDDEHASPISTRGRHLSRALRRALYDLPPPSSRAALAPKHLSAYRL